MCEIFERKDFWPDTYLCCKRSILIFLKQVGWVHGLENRQVCIKEIRNQFTLPLQNILLCFCHWFLGYYICSLKCYYKCSWRVLQMQELFSLHMQVCFCIKFAGFITFAGNLLFHMHVVLHLQEVLHLLLQQMYNVMKITF